MSFEDLNLSPALLNALNDLGFKEATPIQAQAFSVIKSGRDVVGIAQTGTGKTFAYLLPTLTQLRYSNQREPRIVILVPTRELVVQMVTEVEKLTTYLNLRVGGVYGGTNINTQKMMIFEGVDVLVGTPGRLMDLALSKVLNLKKVKNFIIDEVDEMLSMGFRVQLMTILDLMPRKRQNLMFSATMNEDVDKVIHVFFNNPVYIEPVRAGTPLERIHQQAFAVPNFYTKLNLLEHLLATDETMTKVLIFGPSKRMADLIHAEMESAFPDQFEIIHSNKSQNFRRNAVVQFEKGLCRGLIATDILARGIDVSGVSHVINMDAPEEPESYIHRIGRTGRADKDGESLLFFSEKEIPAVEAIEELMGIKIPVVELPIEVSVASKLTEEEKMQPGGEVNYLPPMARRSGAFHDKKVKNKKVNLGNKTKHLRDMKYKKPISRGAKKRK